MASKTQFYSDLALQLKGLLGDESNLIANMANFSALVYTNLDNVNWAGFYLAEDNQLVLGPFQGNPACIRIDFGKGVCGTAAATGEVQVVEDVHAFAGHIACDAASNSELVVPFYQGNELIGVFDIDSPDLSRFDDEDAAGVQALVEILQQAVFGR